ncbi:MAG: hypothetical protein JSW60_08020 [Thermoplasmatales archaeon]|nr:MAG: hypothetical protein JSW60_08020 [Thermoplasmatales archaeon]
MIEECEEIMETKGLGWRVSLSIVVGVGWLVFLILWLFFYASDYHIYQNIAIVLASLLLMGIILGAPWAGWGMRHRTETEKDMWETKGFKWRVWLSAIIAFLLLVFLILWFYYYARDYDIYQNIAVFIVSILIVGGILGASWAPWGIKHGHKYEKKK